PKAHFTPQNAAGNGSDSRLAVPGIDVARHDASSFGSGCETESTARVYRNGARYGRQHETGNREVPVGAGKVRQRLRPEPGQSRAPAAVPRPHHDSELYRYAPGGSIRTA